MPLYEYQCPQCGRFELIHKFSDAPLSGCPTCGREVQKLPSAPAIQFKGSGWYVTDYGRKSSGGDGAAKGEAKTGEDSKAAEGVTKGETKGESSTSTTTTSKDGSASGNSSSSTAK